MESKTQQGTKPRKSKHDENGGRYLTDFDRYRPKAAHVPEDIEIDNNNTDDLDTILKMGIQSLKRGTQRYPNTPEGLELLKQRTNDYFEYILQANRRPDVETRVYPDIEGLALYLGTTRKTLMEYSKRSPEWQDAINLAKTVIFTAKKQLADNYKIPPVLQIFDATNNYGYHNAAEYHLIPEQQTEAKPTETPEAISAKYGNAALLEPPKADFGSPTSDF